MEETEGMNDGPGRVYVVTSYHLNHDAGGLTQFDSVRNLRGGVEETEEMNEIKTYYCCLHEFVGFENADARMREGISSYS